MYLFKVRTTKTDTNKGKRRQTELSPYSWWQTSTDDRADKTTQLRHGNSSYMKRGELNLSKCVGVCALTPRCLLAPLSRPLSFPPFSPPHGFVLLCQLSLLQRGPTCAKSTTKNSTAAARAAHNSAVGCQADPSPPIGSEGDQSALFSTPIGR